jgi:hypothetical protein
VVSWGTELREKRETWSVSIVVHCTTHSLSCTPYFSFARKAERWKGNGSKSDCQWRKWDTRRAYPRSPDHHRLQFALHSQLWVRRDAMCPLCESVGRSRALASTWSIHMARLAKLQQVGNTQQLMEQGLTWRGYSTRGLTTRCDSLRQQRSLRC